MKKYYFITAALTFLIIGLASCSNEEDKTQKEMVSRPSLPILDNYVQVGHLKWSPKNLDVDHYRNGDPIPQVTDATQWANLTTGAWCYYENNTASGTVYNKLYNWYAVNDPRGLSPKGWHIPTLDEWTSAITYYGGELAAGGPLKSTLLWQSPNLGANNSSGFSALPGGFRSGGNFSGLLQRVAFWTATPSATNPNGRWLVNLFYDSTIAHSFDAYGMETGCSVRCVRDNDVTDIDGNFYKGVSIGTQIWTQSNFKVSHYRNGDIIPQITGTNQWSAHTTGAWCNYANSTANEVIYGKLYNWYAVNDPRGLAPKGWHIPNDAEWNTLVAYLGTGAGGKMKETGLAHWISPNAGANNSSAFTGLPAGYRNVGGGFYYIGSSGYWWSSTDHGVATPRNRYLYYNSDNVSNGSSDDGGGMSVRCIKD